MLLSNLSYRDLLISSHLSVIYLLETLAVRDLDIPGVGWGWRGACRHRRRDWDVI